MNSQPDAPLLFYSYAHEDAAHLTRLRKHLALLKRAGMVSEWYDRNIQAGEEWDPTIRAKLEQARVILLLISADFLASDYCWGTELTRALEKHERHEAVVIPVIVSPADWRSARVGDRAHSLRLGDLQALPPEAKPVTTWSNRDDAWSEVAKGTRTVIEQPPTPDRSQTP